MNKKCQVFTPFEKVIELLDEVGYIKDLYGKKVIENACGDGNILRVIVERYIIDSLSRKININDIKTGLESDIYGAEIDKEHYRNCIKNLSYTAEKYNIFNVSWKVLNTDILRESLSVKFDYVIGNPPYITYRDLDLETRRFVKENYNVCKVGKFDYCYAFIEASINCLSNTGKLAYLIPNSIFKNVFGERLRELMLPYIVKIHDYTTEKLFTVLTSSAIIILDKNVRQEYIEYYDIANNTNYNIEKCLLGKKWIFDDCRLKDQNNKEKLKFGDYFSASISIATLLNEAFVLKNYKESDKYINLNGCNIEKSIVKNAVSPRSLNYKKSELIIFPYKYVNQKLIHYEEKDFQESFPEATRYLKSFSERLEKRKSDRKSKWYEYGRSQALSHLNQEKLLISTVITKEVKVYKVDKDTIPYSGIYIISKGSFPLSVAKKILESKEFLKYVQISGINANGTSLRITPKDINNYEFQL
ncbi:N-6 DNA methylase [Clostridium butyricum]|uniref:Eco57I restriction-modification methylase domain-containing protein n=1 Tax=Clostridium butyricum TaxID=1492 RepID=UPI0034659FED